jgi:hypothetical protein
VYLNPGMMEQHLNTRRRSGTWITASFREISTDYFSFVVRINRGNTQRALRRLTWGLLLPCSHQGCSGCSVLTEGTMAASCELNQST